VVQLEVEDKHSVDCLQFCEEQSVLFTGDESGTINAFKVYNIDEAKGSAEVSLLWQRR